MKILQKRWTDVSRSDVFWLYPIADVHIGAVDCDEARLRHIVAEIEGQFVKGDAGVEPQPLRKRFKLFRFLYRKRGPSLGGGAERFHGLFGMVLIGRRTHNVS